MSAEGRHRIALASNGNHVSALIRRTGTCVRKGLIMYMCKSKCWSKFMILHATNVTFLQNKKEEHRVETCFRLLQKRSLAGVLHPELNGVF